MDNNEKNLFLSEFITEKMKVKSRFVMAPVPTGFVKKGLPTKENIQFYGERAKNVGLIIAGAININHPTAPNHEKMPNLSTTEEIKIWSMITDEVHLNRGKIVAQIWHSGAYRRICLGEKTGFTSPSGICNGKVVGCAMTKEEIKDIIHKFAETAYNAKIAGFDGIEIHGAHGGLIHDFLCRETNQRADEYGLSKTLFAEEVIKSCRQTVGNSFPIMIRLSNFKMYDLKSQLADTPDGFKKIVLPLSEAGIDMFDCSALCFTDDLFLEQKGSLAFWTKKFTNKPTINVGCIGSERPFLHDVSEIIDKISNEPNTLNSPKSVKNPLVFHSKALYQSIKNNEFDLIAVGRPLLLNADWVSKII